MKIKEAEAGKFGALEQSGIQITALEHGKLIGGHLAAIRPQLAIERLANRVEIIVALRASQDGDDFIFERREAAFEIFERRRAHDSIRAPDFRAQRRFPAMRLPGGWPKWRRSCASGHSALRAAKGAIIFRAGAIVGGRIASSFQDRLRAIGERVHQRGV